MKTKIIAMTLAAGILGLAAPAGLRADDQKPATTADGTPTPPPAGGGCHKGCKHHHKDGDNGQKPTPTPAP